MRRLLISTGLIVAQVLALVATFPIAGLGAQGWHHVASLLGALALAAAFGRRLGRSRRFLALGVLATTVLAAASGFWLLYWKEGIRVGGYQDWGVFWHVAWSWLAAIFFFQHTWVNRVALGHFLRRTFSSVPGGVVHVGLYVLLGVAFILTWSDVGKSWFTVENYIPLSLYAWLIATAPPYAIWATLSIRASRLRHPTTRIRSIGTMWRGLADVGLVPLAALVVFSGVPLTFFDPLMDENGWKYVSKYWHVWPSVAFTVIVFVHSVQLWGPVRSHWRNFGGKPHRVVGRPVALPGQG